MASKNEFLSSIFGANPPTHTWDAALLVFEFSASVLFEFAKGVWPVLYRPLSTLFLTRTVMNSPITFQTFRDFSTNPSHHYLLLGTARPYFSKHDLSSGELLDHILLRHALSAMMNRNAPSNSIYLSMQNLPRIGLVLAGKSPLSGFLLKAVFGFCDFFRNAIDIESLNYGQQGSDLTLKYMQCSAIEQFLPGATLAATRRGTALVTNVFVPVHFVFSQLRLFYETLLPFEETLTQAQLAVVLLVFEFSLASCWLIDKVVEFQVENYDARLCDALADIMREQFGILPAIVVDVSAIDVDKSFLSYLEDQRVRSFAMLTHSQESSMDRDIVMEKQLAAGALSCQHWRTFFEHPGSTMLRNPHDYLLEISLPFDDCNLFGLILFVLNNLKLGHPWFALEPSDVLNYKTSGAHDFSVAETVTNNCRQLVTTLFPLLESLRDELDRKPSLDARQLGWVDLFKEARFIAADWKLGSEVNDLVITNVKDALNESRSIVLPIFLALLREKRAIVGTILIDGKSSTLRPCLDFMDFDIHEKPPLLGHTTTAVFVSPASSYDRVAMLSRVLKMATDMGPWLPDRVYQQLYPIFTATPLVDTAEYRTKQIFQKKMSDLKKAGDDFHGHSTSLELFVNLWKANADGFYFDACMGHLFRLDRVFSNLSQD